MSEIVHVTAIVTPAPGKFDRAKELLGELARNVQANEPDTLSYHVFEQYNGTDGNFLVLQESYKDHAAFEAHAKTSYYTSILQMVAEENLLSAAVDIKMVKPFAGFASR